MLAAHSAIGVCHSFTMPKKRTTPSAANLQKRLAETVARSATLKATTEKMERATHELEERLHQVEANARQIHEKVRKQRSQSGSI
jgi:hypothetical protein